MLDPAFLTEAGWDPVSAGAVSARRHPLLGRACAGSKAARPPPTAPSRWAVLACFARCTAGPEHREIISSVELPPLPPRPPGCAVPGAADVDRPDQQRQRTGLCQAHSRRFRRAPAARWRSSWPTRRCGRCPLWATAGCWPAPGGGKPWARLCPTHYARWRNRGHRRPGRCRRAALAADPAGGLRGRTGQLSRTSAAGRASSCCSASSSAARGGAKLPSHPRAVATR